MNIWLFAYHMVLALLMGGLIGLERQLHRRMAGVRTHALVAGGAAVFVMAAPLIPGDPSAQGRIISYVVSGVGFLGAGVIFKEHGQVQGLNTAASIWCAAAVGTFAGIGFPLYALVAVAGVLLVNVIPHKYDHRIPDPEAPHDRNYGFEFVCRAAEEPNMRSLLLRTIDRSSVTLCEWSSEDLNQDGRRKLNAALRTASRDDKPVEELAARFSMEECVYSVRWRSLPENTSE